MENKLKIVAVSGYFDPLHIGHIEYLELASELAEDGRLIVILNNDKQAKLKKGFVYMSEQDRKRILESLWMVDEVVISIDKDKTVCKTLKKISPDIFAKGGDRFANEIPETKTCKELGIKIVDGLGKKIRSSTEILKWKN